MPNMEMMVYDIYLLLPGRERAQRRLALLPAASTRAERIQRPAKVPARGLWLPPSLGACHAAHHSSGQFLSL